MTVSLKKPDAIFFDWDGTLIDSLEALRTHHNYVLGHFGKPLLTLDEARRTIRKSAREVYPDIFGDKSAEAIDLLYQHVGSTHIDLLKPFEGAEGVLKTIHAADIPMAIVSNKNHPNLLSEISHLGWDRFLSDNVGAGLAEKDKPSPAPLLLSAQHKNLDPAKHELWYLGDTETDMDAAVAAGFRPFFIEHGMGHKGDLVHMSKAPVFVQDLGAFLRILTEIL